MPFMIMFLHPGIACHRFSLMLTAFFKRVLIIPTANSVPIFDWLQGSDDVLWVNSHCWVNCTKCLPVNCSLLSETKQAGIACLVEKPLCFVCDACSDTVRQIAYFAETRITAFNTEAVKQVISQNSSALLCGLFGTQYLDIIYFFCFPCLSQLLWKPETIMKATGEAKVCTEVKLAFVLLITLGRTFTHLQPSLFSL